MGGTGTGETLRPTGVGVKRGLGLESVSIQTLSVVGPVERIDTGETKGFTRGLGNGVGPKPPPDNPFVRSLVSPPHEGPTRYTSPCPVRYLPLLLGVTPAPSLVLLHDPQLPSLTRGFLSPNSPRTVSPRPLGIPQTTQEHLPLSVHPVVVSTPTLGVN